MHRRLLIVLMLAIGALLLALSATSRPSLAQFPTFTPGGPVPGATLPPGITPSPVFTATPPLTPPPTSSAPGCTVPLNIPIGSIVTIRPGVNIRSQPSPSAPLLANFQEPRNFTVLAGPTCGGNFFWWQIRGHGVTGWVAERSISLTFITFIDPPEDASTSCPPPLDLATGEEITLLTGVRVRNAPGLEGLVLTVAPINAVALVLDDEPTCADGYNWRRIQVEVVGFIYEGWMAEGSRSVPGEIYVAGDPTPPPCWPPLDLTVGTRARIYYRQGDAPKNLRAGPGETEAILYELVRGVPVEITGGPVCVNGMNWWQVRVLASFPVSGWVAEGARGNYWLRDYDDYP